MCKYLTANQKEEELSDEFQEHIPQVVPHLDEEIALTVKHDNRKIPTLYPDPLRDNYLNYRRIYNNRLSFMR
jgi:hypothetical protein